MAIFWSVWLVDDIVSSEEGADMVAYLLAASRPRRVSVPFHPPLYRSRLETRGFYHGYLPHGTRRVLPESSRLIWRRLGCI